MVLKDGEFNIFSDIKRYIVVRLNCVVKVKSLLHAHECEIVMLSEEAFPFE